MASHPLQRRLQTLRSRVLRLLLVRGLSAIVASVLAAVIALGMIDYALRFRDRGVLVIFAACVLAVFAWTLFRFLGRLHGIRLGDTELALQIEACFPAVQDRLASAVEFLKQPVNDAAAGSAAMRRAAIVQATAQCDEINFGNVLNLRPAFRAAAQCVAIFIVAAGLAALNPAAARTALARLALPLGNVVWPQTTHLQLKNPVQRIARGQPLDIEVVDARGAQLPANCRVHYRFRDAHGKLSKEEESEAMRPLGQAMIARRDNVTRSLEFRVTGGDDQSMLWMPVEVLDPPTLEALSLDVFPPTYANWPRETRDAASASGILSGSRVELSGEANKPLRSAVLRLDGGRELPARIASGGRSFRIGSISPALPDGLVLDKSGGYSIALVDRDGIRGIEEGRQFRVQADASPSVVIERPSGDLFVTPIAQVDLRIDAHDDLALRRVTIVYSASGATTAGDRSLSLYEGPPQAPPAAASGNAGGRDDRRVIDRRWDLEELKLRPGTQLTIFAAATDYRGQTGRSEPRTLTILTAEELQDRLAQRQGRIAAEVARLLQLQRTARDSVRALDLRLHASGSLQQTDIDPLQLAELTQREIVHGLTDRDEGVSALALSILADLETNRIDNPECARRMQGLLDEFTRLQREHLVPIGDELTLAVKGVQTRLQSSPPPIGRDADDEALLARAGEHQQHVIETLEDVLSRLRQWDDYRRFQRDVAQLIRDQQEVARATVELGRQTLGRDLKELSTQVMADLQVLVERQSELARRQNRIEQEMEQTIPLLRPNEPLAADTLSDALAGARRLAIAAAMQGEAGKLRDNDLGQAPAAHQRILQDLQAVLDILANNRSPLEQQARLEDAIRRLHRQESQIERDTREYAALQRSGHLSRAQSSACLNWRGSNRC